MAKSQELKVTIRVVQNRGGQTVYVRGAGTYNHTVHLGQTNIRKAGQPLTTATDPKTLTHLILTQADGLVLSS